MSVEIKKRLGTKQDLNWDTTGTGEKVTVTNSAGVDMALEKINASHVPLTKDSRDLLGGNVTNIEDGLKKVNEKVAQFSDFSVMQQSTVINLLASYTTSKIQEVIDECTRNLGGYTLTINFAEGINLYLVNSLKFDRFSNGKLIINGSNIILDDSVTLDNGLFYFSDCMCEVEVNAFRFKHDNSTYGVKIERCICVYLDYCVFEGMLYVDSFAVCAIGSACVFDGCTFERSNKLYDTSLLDVNDTIDEINTNIDTIESNIDTLDGSVDSLNTAVGNINTDIGEINSVRLNYPVGIPDYVNGVSLETDVIHTATTDGWVFMTIHIDVVSQKETTIKITLFPGEDYELVFGATDSIYETKDSTKNLTLMLPVAVGTTFKGTYFVGVSGTGCLAFYPYKTT